jgi:hypothetical protein
MMTLTISTQGKMTRMHNDINRNDTEYFDARQNDN